MVNPYEDPHAHEHEWSLEPGIDVDEDIWLFFPCNYWEGGTVTDDARDETYACPTYECEARKVLIYELIFEVAGRDPMNEPVEAIDVHPTDADTLVEAPQRCVEHVYTNCEDELRKSFEYIDPEDPMTGFGTDIDGVRVTAELRDSYVEDL